MIPAISNEILPEQRNKILIDTIKPLPSTLYSTADYEVHSLRSYYISAPIPQTPATTKQERDSRSCINKTVPTKKNPGIAPG
jgi:hypothetical protein